LFLNCAPHRKFPDAVYPDEETVGKDRTAYSACPSGDGGRQSQGKNKHN